MVGEISRLHLTWSVDRIAEPLFPLSFQEDSSETADLDFKSSFIHRRPFAIGVVPKALGPHAHSLASIVSSIDSAGSSGQTELVHSCLVRMVWSELPCSVVATGE